MLGSGDNLAAVGIETRLTEAAKRDDIRSAMGLLMLPTAFGAAVYQLNIVIGTLLASYLPTGSISYLYYADRLVQFPLGVFGVAVGTVALPSLAKLATSDHLNEFTDTLNASLRLTLFICLPAAAGLIALADPMVRVLFGRGAFDAHAIAATAGALVAYGVGLPAFACVRPLYSAYFALGDTRTPAVTAVVCLVVYVVSGYALMELDALDASPPQALKFPFKIGIVRMQRAEGQDLGVLPMDTDSPVVGRNHLGRSRGGVENHNPVKPRFFGPGQQIVDLPGADGVNAIVALQLGQDLIRNFGMIGVCVDINKHDSPRALFRVLPMRQSREWPAC